MFDDYPPCRGIIIYALDNAGHKSIIVPSFDPYRTGYILNHVQSAILKPGEETTRQINIPLNAIGDKEQKLVASITESRSGDATVFRKVFTDVFTLPHLK